MMELEDSDTDLAVLCETWLKDDHNPTTALIKSFGYSLVHNPRVGRKGGGTAILFKRGFSVSSFRSQADFKSFEYTACFTRSVTGTKIMILAVYRPGALSTNFISEIDSFLSDCTARCDILVLAGDLNIHFDQTDNRMVTQAANIFASYGLTRHVYEPTHVGGGCLDQIFTFSMNNQLNLNNLFIDSLNTRIGSDHFPIYCDLDLCFEKKYQKTITYREIGKMDPDMFINDLKNLVDNRSSYLTNFGESITHLSTNFSLILESHAPLVTKTVSVIDKAPWFNNDYRDLRKLRRKYEKRARKPNASDADLLSFHKAAIECKFYANEQKRLHLTKMIERSDNSPKTLFKFVNQLMDRKQSLPSPNYTSDLDQLSTDFNNFFSEKVQKIRDNIPRDGTITYIEPVDNSGLPCLTNFRPTCALEIRTIIADSGIKCSPSDMLPTSILKDNDYFEILLPLIVDLVNLSLNTGSMDGVKEADIIPLLKSDKLDPNNLQNFRPVSNLLFIGKLVERVVLRRLNEHLLKNDLNITNQSAYKKNNSTETVLIRLMNDLLVASEEKSATVVMLLDLSAAFDLVDHDLLLKILGNEIGIRGIALEWFGNFLKGRTHRTRLNKFNTSDTIIIKFGVPQGSVLGPVLFNIYIRSIYKTVQDLGFNIYGYADDHQVSKTFQPCQQANVLTKDLTDCFNIIKIWMASYYLQMNNAKTQIIVFGPPRVLNQIKIQGINLGNTTIRFLNSVKNLGIHMDSALTMDSQIVELKKKCFRTLRNICKIRFFLTQDQLKKIVNSLVVSCLDYCNSLYFGITVKLQNQLQLIQNACAKAVTGKYKYDHLEDDLQNLHWLNIKKRVLFKIGLLSYKSVNGFAPEYLNELFTYSHHGHTLKLLVPNFDLERYGRRSFSYIGPKFYNSLPIHISSAPNVKDFKAYLKTYLFGLNDHQIKNLL